MHYPHFYHDEAFKEFLSTVISGGFAETIALPFNSVKVRLQLQGEHIGKIHGVAIVRQFNYKGTTDAIRKMIKEDGFWYTDICLIVVNTNQDGSRSFFRGLSAIYNRQILYNGVRTLAHYPVRSGYLELYRILGHPCCYHDVCVQIPTYATTCGLAVISCQPMTVLKGNMQSDSVGYSAVIYF